MINEPAIHVKVHCQAVTLFARGIQCINKKSGSRKVSKKVVVSDMIVNETSYTPVT